MTSRPLSSPTSRELPDGMAERHATAGGSFRRNRGWLALVMLSLLMAGALSGLLGGVHNRDLSIDTPAAAMRVHAPAVLRNGEDRKSVVSGKSVSERVNPGGRRIIKKKKRIK